MLVAGKGGTGKTTTSALLSFFLSLRGLKVLALDTDSVPNLAQALGVPRDKALKIIPLTKNNEFIAKRTGAKPGEAWGIFFRLNPQVDDIIEKFGLRVRDNLRLVVVGSIDAAKEGCLCPAIALARAFLKHVMMDEREAVVVDSEAGAEVFGRGLAENFDHMICVSEPTVKSLDISFRLIEMGKNLGIERIDLLVNKVPPDKLGMIRRKVLDECGKRDVGAFFIPYDDSFFLSEMEGRGVDIYPENSPGVIAMNEAFSEIFSYFLRR